MKLATAHPKPVRGKPLAESPANVHPLIRQVAVDMKTRNMCQDEVGRLSGIDGKTLRNWRMGLSAPKLGDFEAVANVLGYRLTLVKEDA